MTPDQTLIRRLLYLIAALCLAATAIPAAAQADYPNKPVRMLIGFPPGQATDTLGRAVAQKLSQQLGQQFVVENKPGAAGIIATQAAMSSPPDGYTLLVSSSGPLAVNPGLYSKLPYDPIKDFAPVAGIAIVPLVLVTNPAFPVTNVKELIATAKAKPKAVNYASGGSGVTNHLVMEMFRGAAGIDMTHIPYKGGPPAVTDLIGGQVNVMFETSVAVLPFVKQGKLRALAVSSSKRISAAPDLPTVAELGYPGFSGVPWVAIMAPANTPAPIIAKLNGEVNKALNSKDIRDQFLAQGVEPMQMTPEELGAFVKSELTKWTKAVKDSGAKVE
jgi:tripartite-type tricarboxylate transporter receptor subunit TctC